MKARCVASAMSAVSRAVSADTVTDSTRGTWSNSCRLPVPHRPAGARPPSTTMGAPENEAWEIALIPLVTPGPAVRTARPGERVSLPVASAANAAVCSCRTSSREIPWSSFSAASYIGKTCAPESVNMVRTPCAAATAVAWDPPWPATGPDSSIPRSSRSCPAGSFWLTGALPGRLIPP